jgi:hypothetical protein
LGDTTIGSEVRVTKPDGTVTIEPGRVWEQLAKEDKNTVRLQIDIRYAKKHGLRLLDKPRINYTV